MVVMVVVAGEGTRVKVGSRSWKARKKVVVEQEAGHWVELGRLFIL